MGTALETYAPDGRAMLEVASRDELRRWLADNHDRSSGIWLVNHRKGSGKPRLEYAEVVEELLCVGWVDSKPNTLDAERSLLWVSPRRPRSGWSRINKERVARLEAAGRMTPAGRAAVEAAKANGAWNALDAVEALEVPADLESALDASLAARRNFDAFPPSSKKIILTWIATARRPETRARRVEETVRLAAENRRANHYRQ
jgi:uncharacterized protein YdeI (YjbR/CyaY-like superfamily)